MKLSQKLNAQGLQFGSRLAERCSSLHSTNRVGVLHLLLALVLMGLALWLRLQIAPVEAGLQYVTFFPAVTLAAVIAGYRAGLLATLIGTLCATYIFTPPYYSFSLAVVHASLWSNLVFVMDGIIVSLSIEAMHRYRRKFQLELEAARASQYYVSQLNKNLDGQIAERRQAEARLQESRAFYRTVLDSTPDAMIISNERGVITSANRQADMLLGYQSEELIGQSIAILIPERFRATHPALMSDYIASPVFRSMGTGRPVVALRRDGSEFDVEISLSPVRTERGFFIASALRDITDRRLMESRLQLEAITFETHEAIMITDADANIVRVNRAFEAITGYSASEVMGKNPRILNSGRHDKAFYAAVWKTVLSTGTWSGEVWDQHKSGKVVPMHMTITAVKNAGGHTTQYVCIFFDISERKNAEAALRQTENHFVTILDSLDEIIWSASAPDFQLRHVSAATEKLYGVTQHAFMEDPQLWLKVIHPDDRARVEDVTRQIFELGKTEIEYRILREDGQTRWLSDRMYVIYGVNGEPTELVGTAYDITDYKRAEDARRQDQERLRQMLENSPIAVRIATSAGHKVLFANKRYARLINVESDRVTGVDPQQYYANPQDYEEVLRQLGNGTPVIDKLVELLIPGIGTIWAMATYLLLDYENEPAVVGWLYDVTNLRLTQDALQLSEKWAKKSLEELKYQKFALDKHAIVAVTDVAGRITYANQKFWEISGYAEEELIGQDHALLNSGTHPKGFFKEMYRTVASGQAWHDEVCNRAKDGHLYWVDTTIAPFMGENGKPQSYISIRTDISQRKAAEDKSNRLALYDPLTELPNRRLLLDRMQQVLASSERSGKMGSLLFIDLDHFKTINDTLGHDVGDLLLQMVAQRLVDCVREGDTVARLGGDEFVLMLQDLSEDPQEAAFQTETAGAKILRSLNQPYQLVGHDYPTTPSIGVILFSGNETGIDELMKRADIAMYQAKRAGRNTIRFFDPDMQSAVETRLILESSMRQALADRQFQLFYQMQVNSAGTVVGAEILLRWQHPERGMISPADFIPLAEENGMIVPIGQWILEAACAQLKAWEETMARQHLQLAVNVSARQFRQADFVEMVTEVIHKADINPMRLKLELTESLVLDNVGETIAKMQQLKAIGVRFSMDDFGTGHSSLSNLKKLPLDQLKIDQSFVRDIATDPDDAIIVQTIIAMANNLGMEVIAEGVETTDQQDFLIAQECLHFQGYLFGRPVPLAEFEVQLRQMQQ